MAVFGQFAYLIRNEYVVAVVAKSIENIQGGRTYNKRISADVACSLRELNPCQAVLLDGIDFSLDVVPEADGESGLELVVCKGLCEYSVVGDVAIVILGRYRVLLLAELHLDGMFAALRIQKVRGREVQAVAVAVLQFFCVEVCHKLP